MSEKLRHCMFHRLVSHTGGWRIYSHTLGRFESGRPSCESHHVTKKCDVLRPILVYLADLSGPHWNMTGALIDAEPENAGRENVTNVEVRANTGCRPLSHPGSLTELCGSLDIFPAAHHSCRCGDPGAASRLEATVRKT